jgi:putative ABC transport system permease protein
VVIGASSAILFLVFVFWLKNRTQEIGILLALGTSKIGILGQILLEALMIGAVAIAVSFPVVPGVSKMTANYLVEQQVQQEKEQELLNEGKVESASLGDSKETVIGVNVTLSSEMMLFDSSCIAIMILFSVGISGIMVVLKNPKDIFSEIS